MSAWWQGPMLALDFESTGVDAHTCRIVQAALVRVCPDEERQRHLWLLDPGVEVPDGAAAIHGITTQRCRAEGKQPADVLAQIGQAVTDHLQQGLPLIAFNASYDCTLLEAELERHGLPSSGVAYGPVVDPYVLDKHLSRRKGSRKLTDQCEHYQVRLDGAHDAGHDALAAARVAWRIGQRHPEIGGMRLEALHQAQVGWAQQQADSLRAYFERTGKEHDGVDGTWPVRQRAAVSA